MRVVSLVVLASVLLVVRPVPAQGEDLLDLMGTVWVTNRSLNTVAAFDAATGRVLGVVGVGRRPIGIAAPLGAGKVYVADEGSNTVSVLAASGLARLKAIAMGPMPHHLFHDAAGRFIYVAEFGSNQIGVIDTTLDERVRGIVASANPAARTHAAWPAPDGRLYAANDPDELAVIDGATGRLLWTLPVGRAPREVTVSPDGRLAYVSVRDEDKVKVVDLQSRTIVREVPVGTGPEQLIFMRDGRTLTITLRGVPAQVVFLDTATFQVTTVEAGGRTAGHHWLTPDDRYTFVALEGPVQLGAVGVIDNARRRLRTAYPYPGGGQPHGVYYQPLR
jgi:YVTN family beta-propeller protein